MSTVRVTPETHRRLHELSRATGRHQQALIDEAIREYSNKLFWHDFTVAYEKIASDPQAWGEVRAERAIEDNTVSDGIR